ncbi:hypothetical protein SF123566_10113 [Shigella flexneri 1235-66]|nr:hypothetical protein SF123566_10113 [Shigella flexneri 1235-66]
MDPGEQAWQLESDAVNSLSEVLFPGSKKQQRPVCGQSAKMSPSENSLPDVGFA